MKRTFFILCLVTLWIASGVHADPVFLEVENFTVQGDGWKPTAEAQARRASGVAGLNGSTGAGDSVAEQAFEVTDAGPWRVWVRYMSHSRYRGPFDVQVLAGGQVVASQTFDKAYKSGVRDWDYRWDALDQQLQPGKYTLRLRKHENKNVSGYARNIDCFLITNDLQQQPDHVPFGPQTWMRVTLGEQGYETPVQIHIFADHYRWPWYGHYAISKDGVEDGLRPSNNDALLTNGETTGWANISRMIYQDSGARLVVYPAHTYHNHAKRFDALIEFANQPSDDAIVYRFEVDYEPSTINITVPPNLETPENIAKLRTDMEYAIAHGKIADSYDWPKIGRKPQKFPFYIATHLNPEVHDRRLIKRELQTLSHFGFNGIGSEDYFEDYGYHHKYIGNVGWYMKGSYSNPDMERITGRAEAIYQRYRDNGVEPDQITHAQVMDEPTGEPSAKLAKDQPSIDAFRAWIKEKGLTPSDLFVSSWDEVKPIVESERDKYPALHFYTQKFRTVALGNFIAIQKDQIHKYWQRDFPVNVNFSDGAIYYANFFGQGVDYFTLLHETDQNAIWSEDWSNGSSSYQCATYNVELMRGAARKHGQHMGHHLIVYAGRKPYDIRLKAVSEAARGIKVFKSYAYGPFWAAHETSPWQNFPAIWGDQAAVVHEIGEVEDLLMPAMPKPAEVAILYSSATDAWTFKRDLSYGFDRMHTWMALTHAQIPVDIIHESEVEEGLLDNYKVCYMSGPNLTRAAAEKLSDWVKAGGRLILTAGAAERDEFNRPMDTLDQLLTYERQEAQTLQRHLASGRYIPTLQPRDTVKIQGGSVNVLAVKQTFGKVDPQGRLRIEATFADGSPAAILSPAGQGRVLNMGYLPALDYIREALIAKGDVSKLKQTLDENQGIPGSEDIVPLELSEKSVNPWQFPATVREHIIESVKAARVSPPVLCDVPLVDAVYMTSDQGVLIPLANYTLQPIEQMTLEIAVPDGFKEVRSVYQGVLDYQPVGQGKIRVQLPLDCTDFIAIR